MSPAARIRAVFFLHALGSGGFYSRLADIQQQLGLDLQTLGIAFAGYTFGTIVIFFVVSRMIETLGPRRVLIWTLPTVPVATALVALMPNAAALFGMLAILGVVYALPNAAMNIEADRVEHASSARVMNSCHGVWSFGYLLATLLGTLAEALHLSPFEHLALLAVVVTPLALWVTVGLVPSAPRPHTAHAAGHISWPTVAILLLVVYAIGPNLLEAGLRNWSVIYMRETFASPSWVDTLTLPAFLVAQTAGRLSADRWVVRFGVVTTARTLTTIALLGGAIVALAPSFYVALIGFVLIGLGVCTNYPLTTSAAAQIGDRPASQNVASLTLANQLVQLAAPPLMGWVAALFDTRSIFTLALPLVVLSIWLAGVLMPRARG